MAGLSFNDLVPGNIDLNARPVVRNSDGSISTVYSKSFNFDGVETLLPTVSNDGRILSDQEAIDLYLKTGRHLGQFASPDAANAFAQQLHKDQEKLYVPQPAQPTTRLQQMSAFGRTGDINQGEQAQPPPGSFNTNLPPPGDHALVQPRELPLDRNTIYPNDIAPRGLEDI